MGGLIGELRRRNMFRVAGLYAVTGWLLAQAAGVMESSIGLPDWFDGFVVATLLLGFPVALILAWAFEMTPEGMRRTAPAGASEYDGVGKKRVLDLLVLAGLVLVAVVVVGDRLMGPTGAPRLATGEADRSIAVLPFADYSPERDQGYFADGIAEEVLNALAGTDGLRVASRTSAFTFRDQGASAQEVAGKLGVVHVLDGSVKKQGRTLRVTAQLVDSRTDEQVWSGRYDRALTAENVFAIQDEITRAIVGELQGQMALADAPARVANARPTENLEAYELYLRGKAAWEQRTEDSVKAGIRDLTRAVTLDPDFAQAHAALAMAHAASRTYAGAIEADAFAMADLHIERALDLAPDEPEVLTAAAWVPYQRIPPAEQLALFDRAIAANPNDAEPQRGRSIMLLEMGQEEAALAAAREARALDPLSVRVVSSLANVAESIGEKEVAKRAFAEAIRLDPGAVNPRLGLAALFYQEGDVATAHRLMKSAEGQAQADRRLGYLYGDLGMWDEAAELIGPLSRGYKALYEGDREEALRLAARVGDELTFQRALLKYNAGDPAELLTLPLAVGALGTLLGEEPLGPSYVLPGLIMTTAADLTEEERAVALGKIDAFFEGRTPTEETEPWVVRAGAAWRALHGDPEGAAAWLNAADRAGRSDVTLPLHPLFEPLRGTPAFEAWKDRIEERVAPQRETIRKQLADPPEVWWSPDELLGDETGS